MWQIPTTQSIEEVLMKIYSVWAMMAKACSVWPEMTKFCSVWLITFFEEDWPGTPCPQPKSVKPMPVFERGPRPGFRNKKK